MEGECITLSSSIQCFLKPLSSLLKEAVLSDILVLFYFYMGCLGIIDFHL